MLAWFKAEGGLYPKMGQLMAQRGDVERSETFRGILRSLQDDCAKMDFHDLPHQQEILDWTTEELGSMNLNRDAFQTAPIAAGSTAQVHGLGVEHVMKINLPPNKDKMEKQFNTLDHLAHTFPFSMSPLAKMNQTAQTFKEDILAEFDMQREGKALQDAGEMVAEHAMQVSVPKVVAFCEQVVIMERINGVSLTTVFANEYADVSRDCIKRVFDFIGLSMLLTGLVHCDLHSGNIYAVICPVSRKVIELVFIDWACHVRLTGEEKKALQIIFSHLAKVKAGTASTEDQSSVANAMVQLGFHTKKDTVEGLAHLAIDAFDSTLSPPSLLRLERGHLGSARDPLRMPLPRKGALLMRAVILLGGLALELPGELETLNTINLWEDLASEQFDADPTMLARCAKRQRLTK